jgi:hypothetical protein
MDDNTTIISAAADSNTETAAVIPAAVKVKKPRPLTMKQKKFVEVVLQTNNASEAMRQAYLPDNPTMTAGTLRAMGSENLAKPSIQQAIEELRGKMTTDSYWMYSLQKGIMLSAINNGDLELGNKIINKTIDRAGLMPVQKSESRNITAKYTFKRGDNPA